MDTGSAFTPLRTVALRITNSVFISLLVVTGLLMIPVSCTCGSAVPHGHSLFQLPHHNHASLDEHDDHEGHESAQVSPTSIEQLLKDWNCNEQAGEGDATHHRYNFAVSNALEKHDGAVVQAPPSSSIGHPIAMTQPSLIALPGQECQTVFLPPARTLEGADPGPETPPPRALTLA